MGTGYAKKGAGAEIEFFDPDVVRDRIKAQIANIVETGHAFVETRQDGFQEAILQVRSSLWSFKRECSVNGKFDVGIIASLPVESVRQVHGLA